MGYAEEESRRDLKFTLQEINGNLKRIADALEKLNDTEIVITKKSSKSGLNDDQLKTLQNILKDYKE